MVSIKKVNTGGGSGLATPTWWNGRQAASEVSREQNVYVTTKVDITPGADVPMDLRKENHKLLSTLKYSNNTCFSPREPSHHGQLYSGTRQDPKQDVSANAELHDKIEVQR